MRIGARVVRALIAVLLLTAAAGKFCSGEQAAVAAIESALFLGTVFAPYSRLTIVALLSFCAGSVAAQVYSLNQAAGKSRCGCLGLIQAFLGPGFSASQVIVGLAGLHVVAFLHIIDETRNTS